MAPLPSNVSVRLGSGLALAGLMALSVFVVHEQSSTSRFLQGMQQTHRVEHQTVQNKLTRLEQRLTVIEHQPTAVSRRAFDAARMAIHEQLTQLQQGLTSAVSTRDLRPWQARIERLEARLQTLQKRLTHHATAISKPRRVKPPFRIVGDDWRGGQHFLALASGSASPSLSDVRLLYLGETYRGWRLERLDGMHAVFRVHDQMRCMAVP